MGGIAVRLLGGLLARSDVLEIPHFIEQRYSVIA